jgi:dimethylaniline monooxygenase (N-oxide forming)
MPYISASYRSTELWNIKRSSKIQVPIPNTSGRVIDLAPWPDFIGEDGVVHFIENGRPEAERMRKKICKPDILIFATGYNQELPFLDKTYPKPEEADMREIWKRGDVTVGFIGFVRPGIGKTPFWIPKIGVSILAKPVLSTGAIPPLAELQAQLWILALHSLLPKILPSAIQKDYQVGHQSGRIQYAVDHESYAYRLALDMGSAPSFSQVVARGWKVAVTWAIGPSFNTKFRIVGPWKWEGSEDIMRGELYRTVMKRGGWVCELSLETCEAEFCFLTKL